MTGAKISVLYPTPTDVDAFEKVYVDEHMPMAGKGITGAKKFVMMKVSGAAGGAAPYHRITEIHFDSLDALQQSLATPSTQQVAAHAVQISSGGPPIFLIGDHQEIVL